MSHTNKTTTEEPSAACSKEQPGRPRSKFLRWTFYSCIVTLALLASVITAISIYATPERIKTTLQDLVADQTGGRLTIDRIEFNALKKLVLHDIAFYPPTDTQQGSLNKTASRDEKPAFTSAKLDINYRLLSLLAGKFQVQSVLLKAPQLFLKEVDGVSNLDSIAVHRSQAFPEDKAPQAAELNNGQSVLAQLAGLDLSIPRWLLFLPIDVLIGNVGIENFSLSKESFERGKLSAKLEVANLSFNLGVSWYGNESLIWANGSAPFEQQLQLLSETYQATGEPAHSINLSTTATFRLEMQNLKFIHMKAASSTKNLTKNPLMPTDLVVLSSAKLALNDNFLGTTIDALSLEIGRAFSYQMFGSARLRTKDNEATIQLDLQQSSETNLDELATVLRPIIPDISGSGTVELQNLAIAGPLNIDRPDLISKAQALPQIDGSIILDNMAISSEKLGFSLGPINGKIALGTTSSLGSGTQADFAGELLVDALQMKLPTPAGPAVTILKNLQVDMTGRFIYPSLSMPVLRIAMEADQVATTLGGNTVAAPFYFKLHGDSESNAKKVNLGLTFELPGLLEGRFNLDCHDLCQRFRLTTSSDVAKLSRLYDLSLPLLSSFQEHENLPKSIDGSVEMQVNARGRLPKARKLSVDTFLKDGELTFDSRFTLTNFNLKIPKPKAALKDQDLRLSLAGNLQQQNLTVTTDLGVLDVYLEERDNSAGTTKEVSLHRLKADLAVTNTITGPINLVKLGSNFNTTATGDLHLGQLSAEGLLPKPLIDTEINLSVDQAKLREVIIRRLQVQLPTFGMTTGLSGQVQLDRNRLPSAFEMITEGQMGKSPQETLSYGLALDGKLNHSLKLQSANMTDFTLLGSLSFDDFGVEVQREGDPILKVTGVNGRLPVAQRINLSEWMASIDRSTLPTSDVTAQPASAASDQATNEPTEVASNLLPKEQVKGQRRDQQAKLSQQIDSYLAKVDSKTARADKVATLVDYGNVRTSYTKRQPISIGKIEAFNLQLEKLEFDVELRQRWFAINQFLIHFLGGKVQGDFQLAFDPLPNSLRTTVHMTRLDTRLLLAKFPNLRDEVGADQLFSDPYLDGTVHLNFDLETSDMTGAIEITSIGKEQMRLMLTFIDPNSSNPTIAKMRRALSIGEVRQVSIPIGNGKIGMDVDVRILKTPLPIPKLNGFPIGQLVQNFKNRAIH